MVRLPATLIIAATLASACSPNRHRPRAATAPVTAAPLDHYRDESASATHDFDAARRRALDDFTTRHRAAAAPVVADYDRRIATLQAAGDFDGAVAARIAR